MRTVSILVPVFKVERYIERCVRSLFEQTYPCLEFVFVNDCTTDRSMEVLRQLIEEYPKRKHTVKLISHERNKGVAASRNTLLDNARGEFVCYVDADDWLERNAIELLIQKQSEKDADIVSGNILIHRASGIEELVYDSSLSKEERLIQQLKDTWTMDTFIWGRLFKRSLFEDNHIRCIEGCNYAEDRYQFVRLSYFANRVDFVKNFIYNYEKRNAASITVRQKSDMTAFLSHQYQHLLNWKGICDFFFDKENQYYQLAFANTLNLLELNLKWSLKYRSRDIFQHVVELIDENEDCMRSFGWQTSGAKGFFLHNYYCMWGKQIVERSIRFIRRTMSLGE